MEYDEAIKRAEAIIADLEQADALSMDEYKRKAAEAAELLKQCKASLDNLMTATIDLPGHAS